MIGGNILTSLLGISEKSHKQLDAAQNNLDRILHSKEHTLSVEEKEIAEDKLQRKRLLKLEKKEEADRKKPISIWEKEKEKKKNTPWLLLGLGAATLGGMAAWKNKDEIQEKLNKWAQETAKPWLEEKFTELIEAIGEELKKLPVTTNSILEEAGLAGVDETAAANEPGSLKDKITKKKEQLKNLSWLEKIQGVGTTLEEQIEYLQTGETVSYGSAGNIRDARGGSLGLVGEMRDIVSGDIAPHINNREGEDKEVLERLYELTKDRRRLVDIYNEAIKNNKDQKKIAELDEHITKLEEEALKLLKDNESIAKALIAQRDSRIEKTSHPEFVVPQPQKKQRGGAIRKVPGNTTGDKHFVWQNPGDIVVNRNAAPLFFQKGGLVDTGYNDYKGRDIRFATPAAKGFDKMAKAALQQGIDIGPGISSSYRSNAQQANMSNPLAAAPGTSKHNFGEAFDINWYSESGKWIRKNAHKYGFKFNDYASNSTHFDWVGKKGNVTPGSYDEKGVKAPDISTNLFGDNFFENMFQLGEEEKGTEAGFLGFFGNVGLGLGSMISTVGKGFGEMLGIGGPPVIEPNGLTNPEELKEDPKEVKAPSPSNYEQYLLNQQTKDTHNHEHARGGVVNVKSIKQDNTMHDKFIDTIAKRSGRQVIIVTRPARTVNPPNTGVVHQKQPVGSGINMMTIAQTIHRINGANN